VGGPPGQLILGAAALAQVDQLADHVARPSLAVEVQRVAAPGGGQPGVAEHRDRLPVNPPAALLELVAGRLAGEQALELLDVGVPVLGMDDGLVAGGRLALRLTVGDQAARWPEEGAADVQDGKRFELDQRLDLVLNPSSVLSVAVTGEDGDGSPAGMVREPYLGDGPWTIEFTIEVTPLET
jgi:hypothetical protein